MTYEKETGDHVKIWKGGGLFIHEKDLRHMGG